jgi:hypothetical protein
MNDTGTSRTILRHLGVLLCALALASACDRPPVSPHEALAANAEPLRAQFNRDASHTRIVLLAAPT